MKRADADDEVLAFPMISIRPVECEFDLLAFGKRFGREIGQMNPQPRIVCLLRPGTAFQSSALQ